MSWQRFLRDLEEERKRQDEEAEVLERYKLQSDDVLQKKREELEAKLESLKREFPDWEIQSGIAAEEIRRLEKQREEIVVTLSRRGKLGRMATGSDQTKNALSENEILRAPAPSETEASTKIRSELFTHSEDYRMVTLRGKTHALSHNTGPHQALSERSVSLRTSSRST